MRLLLFSVLVLVFSHRSNAGPWDLPDPIAAAGAVVDGIGSGVESVAKGAAKATVDVANATADVANEAVNATAEVAQEADKQIISGPKSILSKVHRGVFDVEKGFVNGLDEVIGTPVDLKQLTFHLVTPNNVGSPKKIDFYKPEEVAKTTGKIFFIVHGWQSSSNASWVQNMSEILVKTRPNAHVVQVNWDGPASDLYAFGAFNTESVGNFVGNLVNRLVIEHKVPKENIILIGHSLGGQICGWAGKKFRELTGKILPRIIALDPAGPLFILRPDSRRLNKHDAEVVMVVHTDADKLGFSESCGTIDFYPNGGDNQPGCWKVDLGRVSTYTEPVAAGFFPKLDSMVSNVVEATKNATDKFQEDASRAVGRVVNGTKEAAEKLNEGAYKISKGIVNGVKEVIGVPVNLDELTFHLVTSRNKDNAKELDFYDPGGYWATGGKVYFLIHGWKQSRESDWIKDVSKTLVTMNPRTRVVQVDWRKPANDAYPFSAFDTESAGSLVSIFINLLTTTYHVEHNNIVLVGHSLGAQVAGWAGRKFQFISGVKLPRIIALDPAGPLYALRPDSKRLNKNDAEVVMVVHTDGDKLGFPNACGTIDFFPNGGKDQPGCRSIDIGNLSTYTGPVTCDHSRAWEFFREAVRVKGSFPARQCKSFKDFKNNKCADNQVVAISDLETEAEGTFFLRTNDESPYSQPLNDGKEGRSKYRNRKRKS